MNYKININNKIYTIKKIDELSLNEYNQIYSIIENNDYYSLFYMLTDIPSDLMNFISLKEIKKINWNEILKEPLKTSKIKNEYLGLKLINLNNISVGRYIDLDYFLTETEENKIQNILSLLILPEYDVDSLKLMIDKINNNLSISEITPVINMFVNWRNNFLKNYHSLFNVDDDDDVDVESDDENFEFDETQKTNNQNTWLSICYENAQEFYYINNKNIFESSIISLLNWLTWKNEKIKTENENRKKH
jgi:hypothetical protein